MVRLLTIPPFNVEAVSFAAFGYVQESARQDNNKYNQLVASLPKLVEKLDQSFLKISR
jgi:hypothetical protein